MREEPEERRETVAAVPSASNAPEIPNMPPHGDIVSLMSRTLGAANRYLVELMAREGLAGIVPSHGDILMQLFACGEQPMQELARAIGRDPSTVTALVKKLAAAGYVRTEKGVEDRRATIVSLTERGRGLRGEFEAVSKELSVVQGLGIDPTDMETARRVLGTVRDNFEHALKKEDGHGRGA